MIRETHAYRFISKVSDPAELSQVLKPYLSKPHSENDRGKNCSYRINDLTISMSLTSGKITLYANKKEDINSLEELLPPRIFDEIKKNKKKLRREIREYKPLGTKSGYSEDHFYTTNKVGRNRLPSPSSNLQFIQRKICLDDLDIDILRYIYYTDTLSAITKIHSRFGVSYHTFWRRLGKLFKMGLIEKLGDSPAIYVPVNEGRKYYEIKGLINTWRLLFSDTL